MQVARQVDLLDGRLREEQESSIKALEALLAQSGLAVGGRPLSGGVAANAVSKMLPEPAGHVLL